MNQPPKQHGGPNDDLIGVAFTATRKRMDLFSAEEQDVPSEIKSIMQSSNKSCINQGVVMEKLPTEDQVYVIDNVLNYPNNMAEIGVRVDFVMVKRHSNFQENSCFYVVVTDGDLVSLVRVWMSPTCNVWTLESFVKGKCPTVAESFSSENFRKPR